MAVLAVQAISRAGLAPSYAAADVAGDEMPNNRRTFLHVKNGGAAPVTVTLVIQQTVDGQPVTARTVNVPAGSERMIGPFGVEYNDAETQVQVTYSDVTSVTVAALSLG